MGARWRAWPVALAGLLAIASASADQGALGPLLESLELRGYPSRVAPPSFGGTTFDDRPVSTADLRGKVVVLNFWASWCLECRTETPMLERIQREFASRGLAIVGVNVRESRDAVGRYARELGLTYPLVLDPDGKITGLYGVVGLPATFVVGRDGRAVALAIGPRAWESPPARAFIEALLAEPAPGPAAR
jgi:thiol-disulfide isomerase/thioredoxin